MATLRAIALIPAKPTGRSRNLSSALLLVMLVGTAGCYSQNIYLRQPQTGQLVTCYGYPLGFVGSLNPAKQQLLNRCADDYMRQGYMRVPDTESMPPGIAASPVSASVPSGAGGLNGTYTGLVSGSVDGRPFSMRVTLTIVESGDQIVGAWTTTEGTAGTLLGRIGGSTIADVRVRQTKPCVADFAGSASIERNGTTLRGSYGGDDCGGPVTASFEVSRQ